MKRPPGFEHRPAPRPPASAPRPAATPERTGPATGRTAGPKRPSDTTTTEPITIQPVEPVTLAPVFPLRPADDRIPEPPDLPPALTPKAARSRLRGARRARKQYEREEVRRFTWRSRRRRTTWLVSIGTVLALVGFVLAGA